MKNLLKVVTPTIAILIPSWCNCRCHCCQIIMLHFNSAFLNNKQEANMRYLIHGLSWDHEEQKGKGWRKRERECREKEETAGCRKGSCNSAFTQIPRPVENCASSQTASPIPPNKIRQEVLSGSQAKTHISLPLPKGPCPSCPQTAAPSSWCWAVPGCYLSGRLTPGSVKGHANLQVMDQCPSQHDEHVLVTAHPTLIILAQTNSSGFAILGLARKAWASAWGLNVGVFAVPALLAQPPSQMTKEMTIQSSATCGNPKQWQWNLYPPVCQGDPLCTSPLSPLRLAACSFSDSNPWENTFCLWILNYIGF